MLGGTLDLEFADGVDPSTLLGETFQLFNWSGAAGWGSIRGDCDCAGNNLGFVESVHDRRGYADCRT